MSKSAKIKIGIALITTMLVGSGIYTQAQKQKNEVLKAKLELEKKEQTELAEKAKAEEQAKKAEEKLEKEKKIAEEKKAEEKKKQAEEEKEAEKKKQADEKKNLEKKQQNNEKPKDDSKQVAKEESKENPPKVETEKKPETLAEKVSSTKTASRTNQIITVIGGKVTLWNKNNGKFVESFKTSSRHGYGGMTSASNKREGDGKTPTGVYPILYAFGTEGNPGTSFNYRQITQNSYFVDDVNSKYYNQWYEGTDQKGEHMIKYKTQYKYGLVIGYNTANVPGKGSAIFLHCNGSGNTAGCVSIPTAEMLKMMKQVKPGAQIIITTSEANLKNY